MTEENIEQSSEGIKNLREKVKALETENKELKGVVKTSLFKDVGLDPNSGTGKMAFDLYDGKPDTAELGNWLKENYNIDTTVQQNNDLAAQKIAESDAKLTNLQQQSVATQPTGTEDVYNKIMSEGSVQDRIRAKVALQQQQENNN
jgi:hypothetical protein